MRSGGLGGKTMNSVLGDGRWKEEDHAASMYKGWVRLKKGERVQGWIQDSGMWG